VDQRWAQHSHRQSEGEPDAIFTAWEGGAFCERSAPSGA
jgi:hypothetical protein